MAMMIAITLSMSPVCPYFEGAGSVMSLSQPLCWHLVPRCQRARRLVPRRRGSTHGSLRKLRSLALPTERTPAEAEHGHGDLLALLAQVAVAGEHVVLPVEHEPGAAVGQPNPADQLGHLGSALDQPQDLGVQPVDLLAQLGDLLRAGQA